MTTFSSYPHFVADQVLTASHLNGIFNFLDEQNRLTRNKLLGIGIVCGLDSDAPTSVIHVSKGTGITSAGYLIAEANLTFTHYRPTVYKLPDDFLEIEADYGYPYSLWENHAYELLPNATSNVKATDIAITSGAAFFNDKILVYLLEKNTTDLKNCTSNDCDDKGERVDFTLKPLLVDKSVIDAAGNLFSNTAKIYPEVDLKRLYLPTGNSIAAQDVFDSFKTVFSDGVTLQQLEAGLDKMYMHFGPLFPAPNATNPFAGFAAAFGLAANNVLITNKFMFQYIYDWLDDLIKAYYEFTECASQLIADCCPSEALFPMHLLISEANKSSSASNAAYRSQFIYSPLFQANHDGRKKLQSLIVRMLKMFQQFKAFTIQEMRIQNIEITPSNWTRARLSERCIPFYYDINSVLLPWNYNLSRLGKEARNLSYNSGDYSGEDAILNPLDYDIEKYDFYRIEGHIGKRITAAFQNVTTMRNDYNLGFDVVALNLNLHNLNLKTVSKDALLCTFRDIDSAYRMAITGLMEDLHRSVCFVTHLPFYQVQRKTDFNSMVGGNSTPNPANEEATNAATKAFFDSVMGGCFKHSNTQNYAEYIDTKETNGYNRGQYISDIFTPIPATVGKVYLNYVAANTAIPSPTFPSGFDIVALLEAFYNRALYFLEVVEKMIAQLCEESMLSLLNENTLYAKIHVFEEHVHQLKQEALLIMGLLAAIKTEDSKKNTHLPEFILDLEFDLFVDELELLLDMGFEEKIKTLIHELNKRKLQVAQQFTLNGYLSSHHGLEHKAGVPRGGTFVMLYSYIGNEKNPGDPIDPDNPEKDDDFPCDDEKTNWGRVKKRKSNYYTNYISGKASPNENDEEYIKDRYERKGTVFADFYLPYLCCGGCGSPIIIDCAKNEDKIRTKTMVRSVKWDAKLKLAKIVKEKTADAAFANLDQMVNPDGLNIVNFEIINAPKINNQYQIVYLAEVETKQVKVNLVLNISVEEKQAIRKISSNAKACLLSEKINLMDLIKQTELATPKTIKSAGGLLFDNDFNILNPPTEDESFTVTLEGTTALNETVELTINIEFYKPNIDMTLVVKFKRKDTEVNIKGTLKASSAEHKSKIKAFLTDGVKLLEIEQNQAIREDQISVNRTSSSNLSVSVKKIAYFAVIANENEMNPETTGIVFIGKDEIKEFKETCAKERKSDIINTRYIQENMEFVTKSEGKTLQYIN